MNIFFQNCIEGLTDQSNTVDIVATKLVNNSMKQQRGCELLTKVTQSISSVSQSSDSDSRDCEGTERVANEMTRYTDKDNSYLLTLVQKTASQRLFTVCTEATMPSEESCTRCLKSTELRNLSLIILK